MQFADTILISLSHHSHITTEHIQCTQCVSNHAATLIRWPAPTSSLVRELWKNGSENASVNKTSNTVIKY
jgi:hypothetical protein